MSRARQGPGVAEISSPPSPKKGVLWRPPGSAIPGGATPAHRVVKGTLGWPGKSKARAVCASKPTSRTRQAHPQTGGISNTQRNHRRQTFLEGSRPPAPKDSQSQDRHLPPAFDPSPSSELKQTITLSSTCRKNPASPRLLPARALVLLEPSQGEFGNHLWRFCISRWKKSLSIQSRFSHLPLCSPPRRLRVCLPRLPTLTRTKTEQWPQCFGNVSRFEARGDSTQFRGQNFAIPLSFE